MNALSVQLSLHASTIVLKMTPEDTWEQSQKQTQKRRQKTQMKKVTLTQNWQELEQKVSVQVTGGVKY